MSVARCVELHGMEALVTVTDLAQRIRCEHPTRCVWEAADFQWWWRLPRSTDSVPQRFWLDDAGRPIAAGVLTDWGGRLAVDVLTTLAAEDTVGDPADDVVEEAWSCTVRAARRTGRPLEAMVDVSDRSHVARLERDGFMDSGARGGSAWIRSGAVPAAPSLSDGYRLVRRSDTSPELIHHFAERNGEGVEQRLGETSLYRRDLDLAVMDPTGAVAAYGLFWWDPLTRTGFVEPMGTAEEHRRRGLARFVLLTGLWSLVEAGATRIRINYDADHEPSRSLYLGTGFEPAMETALFVTD